MSLLDALPDVFAAAFAPMFRDAVLQIPGAWTPDGQGGGSYGAPVSRACKALVDDFSDYRRLATGIPASDRKIIILAASIEGGAVPEAGHTITAEGQDWTIVGLTRDPAKATYEAQARVKATA